MYRGFNLHLDNEDFSYYLSVGKGLHEINNNTVKNKLDSFKDRNGNLIASRIIADWFPDNEIKPHVFLSHSHKDKDQIIGLAGWLHSNMGITSFIDSCIWGYAGDLLKMIDDEYCYRKSSKTYDYQKRNRSTSHVYMMLSMALAKMIDSCECIIFVNTPNSISAKDYINDVNTDSPWIYSEIAMTSLVQKRSPEEHRRTLALESATNDSMFNIRYSVNLKHLTSLNFNDLCEWNSLNSSNGAKALDSLYKFR